jgi:hypothetical protein
MTHGGKREGAGRPEGSRSERSKQWEELGHSITSRATQRVEDILMSKLESLDSAEQNAGVELYCKLLEYFKPKLARSEVKHEGDSEKRIIFEIVKSQSDDQ